MRDFPPPERFRDVLAERIAWEIALIVPVGTLVYLAVFWRNAVLIGVAIVVTALVAAGLWRRQQREKNRTKD